MKRQTELSAWALRAGAVACLVGLVLATGSHAAPLPLVQNDGQWPAAVRFAAAVPDGMVWLTDHQVLVALGDGLTAIDLRPGAAAPVGRLRQAAWFSFFHGPDPSRWRAAVPAWSEVMIADAWPGVDLRLQIRPTGLRYDLDVAPGAAVPADVVGPLAGDVALRLATDPDGRGGDLRWREAAPAARTAADGLVWCTFLGGGESDKGLGIGVGDDGCPVVTGRSRSADFPTTPGGGSLVGINDVFVAKLSPDGSQLLWGTLIGSSGEDGGMALAIAPDGDIVIAGLVSDGDWPTTPGAFQTVSGGRRDAAACKLSPDGTVLRWSTYIGGALNDVANRVFVGADGCPILVGDTESSDWPTTPGAHDRFHDGGWDAFMVRLAADGSALLASTLLGGGDDDMGRDVILDPDVGVVMVGSTRSNSFPTTAGAFQTAPGGGEDGYLAALDPGQASLLWSTRLGGGEDDAAMRLVPAPDGGYVITGGTRSADFPVSADAYDTTHNGNDDAFVATMDADGSALAWSTFLGGANADRGLAIAVDAAANVTVAGYTLSTDLPVTLGAFDLTANGSYDVFVHQLSADGRRLRMGTYLGGGLRDETYAARFLDDGHLVLVGVTESEGFPVTAGAYQEGYAGLADAFVAELDLGAWLVGVGAPPGVALRASASPNPFNPRRDRLPAGRRRRGRVTVHDLRGRLVRRWAVPAPAGEGRVIWDGLDAAGRPVAAGAYVYRVGQGGAVARGKLALVR
ncbi:MAG: hypothetical protein R3D98_07310 [Candidatus Krumholzibacteriia bacterium]